MGRIAFNPARCEHDAKRERREDLMRFASRTTTNKRGTSVSITGATEGDALIMAGNLNSAQSDLILSLGEKTVSECVMRSLTGSSYAKSARIDGELVAMWGAYPLGGDVGYPWMYSTPDLRGVPRLTVTIAVRVVNEMHERFPRLYGCVDRRFEKSVRFAEYLGFKIEESTHDPMFYTIDRKG